jgi:hypothetical protein
LNCSITVELRAIRKLTVAIRPFHSRPSFGVNEFYKEGCSIKRDVKKKLPLDRRARFFLEIQPTVVRASLEGLACGPFSWVSSVSTVKPSSLQERQRKG